MPAIVGSNEVMLRIDADGGVILSDRDVDRIVEATTVAVEELLNRFADTIADRVAQILSESRR